MKLELDDRDRDYVLTQVVNNLTNKVYNEMAEEIRKAVREVGLADLKAVVVPHIKAVIDTMNIEELIKSKLLDRDVIRGRPGTRLLNYIEETVTGRVDDFVRNELRQNLDKHLKTLKETVVKRMIDRMLEKADE